MTNQQSPEDNLPERINKIFSGQEFPSYASLSEVDAMRKRISELEKELTAKQQMADESSSLPQPSAIDSKVQKKLAPQIKRVANTSLKNTPQQTQGNQSFFKKIRRFFSAPIFVDDLKKTQSAKLLYQIIMVIWALPILLVTIGILGGRAEVLPPAIVISLMLIILMVLSRIGWVGLTGTLMTALVVLIFGFADLQNAGNIQPSTLIIAVAIILSGLLLGRRAPILTAILIAATHAVIVYFQIQGVIELKSAPAVGFENIVITSIMILIIGSLYQFVISRLQLALDETRENEQELYINNQELQVLQSGLEQRVADRTHDLELASEVGRNVSTKVGNLSSLLNDAVELIRSSFDLYYTQIYITEPSGRSINLRAGTGDVGKQLLNRGHHLLVSSNSLNGRAASERQTVLVSNTGENPNFLPNPLLPKTRSEMTVPLIAGNRVVGVLDMQSAEVNALNIENQPAFEALAGQLAIAIQNAALFEQTERARLEVEEQSKQQSYTNWVNFLNAIDRNEKVGYIFNQNEVLPFVDTQGEADQRNAINTPITIAGLEIGGIHISDDPDRKWTATEAAVINETATQLSRHIENLRLLAQSDKYRLEAEQVSSRLTREGWNNYLATRKSITEGFVYENNQVQPISAANELNDSPTQSYPIYIRDEHIGDLAVGAQDGDSQNIDELISVVTQQLSSHIESLRLLEQAQNSRLEVQKSQEQYELAVEGSNDGLWDWDIVTNQIYFSPRWKAMVGYGEDELNNGRADFEKLLHPQDHDAVITALGNYLEGKIDAYDMEFRFQHKDGSYRWIGATGKALRNAEGTAYRIAGSHTDITQRKNDEEILAQRANQLATVATLSSTTSTVLDPDELLQTVVSLTKERFNLYHTQIYLGDDAWNTLLLAAGSGEIGKQMVTAGHAIQMDTQKSLVARAARERQAIIVNDVRNEEGFLPNPMLPDTRAEMAVPMIVGDKVLGVFDVQSINVDGFSQEDASIFTTLSAQVAIALQNARLYVEQAATVTQLRELDKLKSSFLANMSHELRTPLNSILGFADVMLEGLDGPLTENMNNDLGLIYKNGQHLLHLINDVLDMAKIDSGKMNLNVEKFNLQEAIEDVTSITSSLANDKNIALIIEPDSDHEVEINADKIRLRQVMINLVNNAIKFTEKGSVSIRVTREENNVLISVKDTGMGIPTDHLESVFQEFTQVDTTTTRKAGGTGLGLPISRRLILMHKGRLWVESSGVEGEGSTFYVFLPIQANLDEEAKVK